MSCHAAKTTPPFCGSPRWLNKISHANSDNLHTNNHRDLAGINVGKTVGKFPRGGHRGIGKTGRSRIQYAPAIQSAANGGTAFGHEFKTQKMTNNNPKVVMNSRVQCAGPVRCIVIYICQISRSNIAWATQTPSSPPITCKMTNCTACPGRGRRAGQMPAYPLD